ncbi:hypothetical protein [Thermomonas sp. LB-4]|uniref:hypothetical protein n=1 Tax=Thermomonas sp. LB-4 TaxID=3102790 RepID=UPI002EDAC513
MDRTIRSLLLAFCVAVSGTASAGDTLLIQRVQEEPGNLPARGLRMADVEARYGAPAERLDRRGGQKRAWPAIDRWVYPAFTVYFEQGRVIDAVANKAGADEIGPKPAAR